ncbi:MAG TPA: TSUP family transporter, partial [Candidatus Lokiarchaeia archaeon]|nr:TSUP family transporter [Candidatus Lokiarchaeia archaeon]
MVVELWVYTLIFIPLALMIGIAAATIGFTAWNIFVPLAFVGFGFPLWDALFVSIAVDFVDAILLTFIYQRRRKVDFRAGIQWGVIAIVAGLIAAGFALTLLPANTSFLKGGVGYIVMLVGAGFFLRGWKALKNAKNSPKSIKVPEPNMKEGEANEIPAQDNKPKTIFSPRAQISIMVVGVVISGALGGLLGMGSGLNFALLFLIILGYDTLRA